MKSRSFKHLILFGLILGQKLLGQSIPNTNLQQLVNVIDSVWIECLSEINLSEDEFVAIQGFATKDSVHSLVRRRLDTRFYENNINLWSQSDTSCPDKNFIVDIFNVSVTYSPGKRQRLFGKQWLNRRTECHLSVQLLAQSGQLMLSKTYQKLCIDRILFRQLPYIEQHGAVLGYPDRPDDSDLLSRLEPWLMIGSIGIVVYLFYIIRS